MRRILDRIVTFWAAEDVTRLGASEEPPATGWAVGPDGAFQDGKLVSRYVELRLGGPDAGREDRKHAATRLLIFEDDDVPAEELVLSSSVEGLDDQARLVVSSANHQAHQIRFPHIGSEHLLLGMLSSQENVAAAALRAADVDFEAAHREMGRYLSYVEGAAPTDDRIALPLTPKATQVLQAARAEAARLEAELVGPEHLLLGVIADGEGVAARILRGLGVELDGLATRVESLIS